MSRRILPPVDPNKEKIINELMEKELEKSRVKPMVNADSSIDDLIKEGKTAIALLMRSIMVDISTGDPQRDTVMNLKDAMTMLHELKKKEKEIFDSLSDEELEQYYKSGK